MRKIVIFIAIFFVLTVSVGTFSNGTFSADKETILRQQYCPKPPYNTLDGAKKTFQSTTGLNFLASKVAEHEIKKEIKKNAKGKFKVRVKSYSMSDAKQGKFKSIDVTGKKIVSSDVYISHIKASTSCDFIHMDLDKNSVGLVEPMVLDYEVKISEDDLNKTLQTPEYQNYTVGIKRRMVKISFFEFSNARVSLKDNEFNFMVDVRTLMGKPFTANIISKLKISNNKIVLENLKFGSTNHKIEGKKMKYLVNMFDPLEYMHKALEQHNCKTLLKSVKIEDGNIIVIGSAFLGKS